MPQCSGNCPKLVNPKLFLTSRCDSPLKRVTVLCGVLGAMFSVGALSDPVEKPTTKQESAANCQRFENTQPICLFTNPEDLAVLPDKKVLLVSEHGGIYGERPGALVFYDIANQQRRTAFNGGDGKKPSEYWGDKSCTEPPGKAFSPHGIDLTQRSDGRWQLLVVQHGGRESIEFFEVKGTGDTLQLVWRGCAVAPENAQLNSVAAGNGEEFFTTKMLSTDYSWQESGDPTEPTGLVYRWSKSAGFKPVPNTEGIMLNGIAAASDASAIYVIYSGESLLKKLDTKTGAVLASTKVPSADNVKWSADGKTLLAASFNIGPEGSKAFARCMTTAVEFCPINFAIIELDPDTLAKTTLFENPDAPMGAGTVGLKVDSTLFIGSFAGNRILQVDLSNPSQ